MKTLLPLIAALSLLLPAAGQSTDSEALAFLKTHAPKIHAEISALKDSEPSDYRSALDDAQEAAADHAKLAAAGDTKAAVACLKMYEIDYEAIAIADKIVATKAPIESEQLTKQLRGLIDASFAQWAIVEQARVERLEKQLAALKTELTDALANRAKVVEGDTAKLIEECRTFQNTKTKQK
jgi:hypothetical protein